MYGKEFQAGAIGIATEHETPYIDLCTASMNSFSINKYALLILQGNIMGLMNNCALNGTKAQQFRQRIHLVEACKIRRKDLACIFRKSRKLSVRIRALISQLSYHNYV